MLRWLSLLFLVVSCRTPVDDPLVPPKTEKTVYRRPDCPSTARVAVKRPSGVLLDKRSPPKTFAGATVEGPVVVTHGGSGSPPDMADGPQGAADLAYELLAKNGTALEAAIAGTVHLEDDPRFNAGTGANIRLDGKTIQMDASLMTHEGEFAAVAVVEKVKNPIKVARLVLDSPHVLMAGEGATRFAHQAGMENVVPVSKEAEEKYEKRMVQLGKLMKRPGKKFDWRAYWNFPGEMPQSMKDWAKHSDTVGTVVRDETGRFAATLSTGGTSVTLYGRVGDVPVYGAGLFAGPAGAVACTGRGEEIIRNALARTVYEAMAAGTPAEAVLRRVVDEFPEEASVGVIAVDRFGYAVASNRAMAYGVATDKQE